MAKTRLEGPQEATGPHSRGKRQKTACLNSRRKKSDLHQPGDQPANQISGTAEEQIARATKGRRGKKVDNLLKFLKKLPWRDLIQGLWPLVRLVFMEATGEDLREMMREVLAEELPGALEACREPERRGSLR